MTLKVTFIDSGREPKEKPNPKYPNGMDVDLTDERGLSVARAPFCETALPYPAPRCGVLLVECEKCGYRAAITTAGRVDDPRSVKLKCKATKQ